MKILLSPSKTRNAKFDNLIKREYTLPLYIKEADYIASKIKEIDIDSLSKIMKIKNELLTKTFDNYSKFQEIEMYPAIHSYSGTVFNEIELEKYNSEQIDYLSNNLRVLSALYGVLKPFDNIKNYRLDMNTKVLEISNYEFWKNKIDDKSIDLNSSEIILNLCSKEFSKMISVPYINVEFKEKTKDFKYKIVGTYSKKARGQMVNYLTLNKIIDIESVKEFNEDGYTYNKTLSDGNNIIFTR